MGVGVRHALFPDGTHWALSLSRAVCSPTPLSAARRMSRSHGGTVPAVAGRNLLSEASSPGSDISCRRRHAGRGADTPARFALRVGTVTAGTAPAFGRTLAPRYGSDLLTLKLRLLCSGVTGFSRRPIEKVDELCRVRSLPAVTLHLRAPLALRAGPFGGGYAPPDV